MLPAIQQSLVQCATILQQARDPWWVIGSAAIALHSFDPGQIGDIDILVSSQDARQLSRKRHWENVASQGTDRFRSDLLLRPVIGNLQVEFMAGLQVRHKGSWHTVLPVTRQIIPLQGMSLFVPEQGELAEILHLFGREKDIARAALLTERE